MIRRGLFLTLAIAVVAAAALAGWLSRPTARGRDSNDATPEHAMSGMSHGAMDGMSSEGVRPLVAGANGTRASAGGLTLEAEGATFAAGRTTQWTFRVLDASGKPVTTFERDQTKLLHLIVVRSDLTGYLHLHPAFERDGTFRIEIRLARAGTYRAIADFTTGERRYALGLPLVVPGSAAEASLPGPSATAPTDGFSVQSTHEQAMAGKELDVRFTVTRGGDPVSTLLRYLGADGHLVALRQSNLAYAHVHPIESRRREGTITFATEFPEPGAYRLFLQFRTPSGVHTAAFTIDVGA